MFSLFQGSWWWMKDLNQKEVLLTSKDNWWSCFSNIIKVRKTQEGGWIVFAFSSFSPTEVTDQKQIEFSFWSDNQNLNSADKTHTHTHTHRERERERERERRKTQSNYTGFFHKPEVVMSPLHFQGEFTRNVISDYNCTSMSSKPKHINFNNCLQITSSQ